MVSEAEVDNILKNVANQKGCRANVTVRCQAAEKKFVVGISGGTHKAFEFAIPVDATVGEIRTTAEKVLGVEP
jgi:hypothetical protein